MPVTTSRRPRLRTIAAVTGLLALAGTATAVAALPHVTPTSTTGHYAEGYSLENGRLVSPVGAGTRVGDFPVTVALSPDRRTAVVVNSGQGEGAPSQGNESLMVIDTMSGRVVQTVTDHETGKPTFYEGGAVWSRDGRHLYVTGGGNNQVYDYAVAGQRLTLAHRWASSSRAGAPTVPGFAMGGIPGSDYLVGDLTAYSRGVAVTPDGHTVLVTNQQGSTVAALDSGTGKLKWETALGAPITAYPESVVVDPAGTAAYVSEQGLNQVARLDLRTGAVTATTPVGDHPTAMALGSGGKRLYVTNANDDSLSVLDVSGLVPRQVGMVSTHLITHEANGSTPDAVAVDDVHHRLHVANAGDNVIREFQIGTPSATNPTGLTPTGAIPTGFYPTSVAVGPGGRILATSAKGLGGEPIVSPSQYIVNIRPGLYTSVAPPSGTTLAAWTRKARADLTYPARTGRARPAGSPIPSEATAGRSPIKHVILIVRENRTFDQVFGDLTRPGANVNPNFLEFGKRNAQGQTITPNIHALANRFALSQNFYSDGEASIQGHHWTTSGVSTDYTEKSYLHYYSDRQHPNDPFYPIVYPRCGSIFQNLARAGRSFRDFGEFVGVVTRQAPTAQSAPDARCATPGGTYDAAVAANLDNNLGGNVSLTDMPDTTKVQEMTTALRPLVGTPAFPQFSYAVLGNDHTDGTRPGKKTPQALVATNDLAVGQFIEWLSHTAEWRSTAVFVEEDDSQDGLDHVNGHRNIFLVASPWAKRYALSNTHVSQASVMHMIELILGIEPLSSYTQYASVPYDMFSSTPDLAPYVAQTPTYPMDKTNPSPAAGRAASVPLNLTGVDLAGPVLEAQLWEATHPGKAMPRPLLAELGSRGGIRQDALAAWAQGRPYAGDPLLAGLTVASGAGDG